MDADEVEKVLSPERLSGLTLGTGLITLPPIAIEPEEED
jgi:hypothetical protein